MDGTHGLDPDGAACLGLGVDRADCERQFAASNESVAQRWKPVSTNEETTMISDERALPPVIGLGPVHTVDPGSLVRSKEVPAATPTPTSPIHHQRASSSQLTSTMETVHASPQRNRKSLTVSSPILRTHSARSPQQPSSSHNSPNTTASYPISMPPPPMTLPPPSVSLAPLQSLPRSGGLGARSSSAQDGGGSDSPKLHRQSLRASQFQALKLQAQAAQARNVAVLPASISLSRGASMNEDSPTPSTDSLTPPIAFATLKHSPPMPRSREGSISGPSTNGHPMDVHDLTLLPRGTISHSLAPVRATSSPSHSPTPTSTSASTLAPINPNLSAPMHARRHLSNVRSMSSFTPTMQEVLQGSKQDGLAELAAATTRADPAAGQEKPQTLNKSSKLSPPTAYDQLTANPHSVMSSNSSPVSRSSSQSSLSHPSQSYSHLHRRNSLGAVTLPNIDRASTSSTSSKDASPTHSKRSGGVSSRFSYSTTGSMDAVNSSYSSSGASLSPSPSPTPGPAATATLTPEILFRYGSLLAFFQSPSCRFFSRCTSAIPIFQRDLAALIKGRSDVNLIIRELQAMNSAGRKFDSFKALIRTMRAELKKQYIFQLLGNGGDESSLFEDFTLYQCQFDDTHPWTSPLLRRPGRHGPIDSVPYHPPPTDEELVALYEAADGSLSTLSIILSGFLDGSDIEPVRDCFNTIGELIYAVRQVVQGKQLGDLGLFTSPKRI